jgi:cytochrome c peroxidase
MRETMRSLNRAGLLIIPVFGLLLSAALAAPPSAALAPLEELGKKLFFDKNLSTPPGQSCAACHALRDGWVGTNTNAAAVYEGALKGRFGNRKPPSVAYAGDSPILGLNKDGDFVGGLFWDGRATGAAWKDPLAEQAGGPFLNPLEQNNPDRKTVVLKVRDSPYAALAEQAWKIPRADWEKNADLVYERLCRSIAAFERSAEVSAFASPFDRFWTAAQAKGLKVAAIDASNMKRYAGLGLGDAELQGLMLFNTRGKCAKCHVLDAAPGGNPPLFTDFTYDNIGVPARADNPFYAMGKEFNPLGRAWVDSGLGGFLRSDPRFAGYAERNMGKHKVPTLRNVDVKSDPSRPRAYMHNGFFLSLKDVVHFYNARDLGGFPPPEVKANVNAEEVGKLGLSDAEENAIVAFLMALTDRI